MREAIACKQVHFPSKSTIYINHALLQKGNFVIILFSYDMLHELQNEFIVH